MIDDGGEGVVGFDQVIPVKVRGTAANLIQYASQIVSTPPTCLLGFMMLFFDLSHEERTFLLLRGVACCFVSDLPFTIPFPAQIRSNEKPTFLPPPLFV